MKMRLHIYYYGSVQGVGFRYTIERTAVSLGLTGWVKNLNDGRVEAIVDGDKNSIDKFLAKTGSVFKEYIRDIDTDWSESKNEFETFDIRFE